MSLRTKKLSFVALLGSFFFGDGFCVAENTPELSFFPRGVYWPWEESRTGRQAEYAGLDRWAYTEQLMQKLHEQNYNLVWVIHMPPGELKKFCELAEQNQLKVVASSKHTASRLKWGGNHSPGQMNAAVKTLTNSWKDVDNLLAYVGIDEPRTEEMMLMNRLKDYFNYYDPARQFWLVIRPHNIPYAMRYLDRDILLTTDPYDFFYPDGWMKDATTEKCQRRRNTQINMTRRLAETYGRPFLLMPQVFDWSRRGGRYYDPETKQIVILPGSFYTWRQTTPAETTWQIWNGIGKGARGMVIFALIHGNEIEKKDFVEKHGAEVAAGRKILAEDPESNITETVYSSGNGLVLHGLEMTPQFYALGELFGKLEPVSDLLLKGTSTMPLCFVDNGNDVFSFEYGGEVPRKKYYAVVVNNDTDNAVRQTVKILPAVERVNDLLTGKVYEADGISRAGGYAAVTVDLEPGYGTVLDLEFPPGEAVALFDYIDFVPGYEKNRDTSYDDLEVQPVSEGRSRPVLAVKLAAETRVAEENETEEDELDPPFVPGSFLYKLSGPKSLNRYPDGDLYFVVNAVGPFDVEFSDRDKAVLEASEVEFSHAIEPYGRITFRVPDGAASMKLTFLAPESQLAEVSLIYSRNSQASHGIHWGEK
ncbi:MAG: alpha amylase C-terminal domain-containing protein [Candidatus Pacebacteria bacterium]|nr:alpha amylase C-terminal domain-containing protein [Candidatus Paceibacterota bacterium]